MAQFVIPAPISNNLPSVPQPLTSGIRNPLDRQVIRKLVNIDSYYRVEEAFGDDKCIEVIDCSVESRCNNCDLCCYRNKWSGSNFNINLSTPLNSVVSMSLSGIEIPNNIYNISGVNETNVFTIISNDYSDPEYIIEIPPGNYNSQQLVNIMNNIFSNSKVRLLNNIEANYDEISGKFSIFDKKEADFGYPSWGIDFRLPDNDRDIKQNLGWILGFRKALYCNFKDYVRKDEVWTNENKGWPCKKYVEDENGINNLHKISTGIWDPIPYGYVSEGALNLSVPRYMFLVVNDFNNNCEDRYTSIAENSSTIPKSNILARIRNTVQNSNQLGRNSWIYLSSSAIPGRTRNYFGPVTIDKLNIQLIDEYGRIIDLNNNDISLVLEFECIYNL